MAIRFFRDTCSVYEIYPQSEAPGLTRIAHLDFDRPHLGRTYVLPETVIWHYCFIDGSDFRVWDYRLNHSISFSVVEYLDSEPEVYFILSKGLKLASNSFVDS